MLVAVAEAVEDALKRMQRDHPEGIWDGRRFNYVQDDQLSTEWISVDFEAISMRLEISTSYAYALLRSLGKRGLISIEENHFSDGDGSYPRREWHYRITVTGRRALDEGTESEDTE